MSSKIVSLVDVDIENMMYAFTELERHFERIDTICDFLENKDIPKDVHKKLSMIGKEYLALIESICHNATNALYNIIYESMGNKLDKFYELIALCILLKIYQRTQKIKRYEILKKLCEFMRESAEYQVKLSDFERKLEPESRPRLRHHVDILSEQFNTENCKSAVVTALAIAYRCFSHVREQLVISIHNHLGYNRRSIEEHMSSVAKMPLNIIRSYYVKRKGIFVEFTDFGTKLLYYMGEIGKILRANAKKQLKKNINELLQEIVDYFLECLDKSMIPSYERMRKYNDQLRELMRIEQKNVIDIISSVVTIVLNKLGKKG